MDILSVYRQLKLFFILFIFVAFNDLTNIIHQNEILSIICHYRLDTFMLSPKMFNKSLRGKLFFNLIEKLEGLSKKKKTTTNCFGHV